MSVTRHFVGIELYQPESTVADMVGFIEPVPDLDGSDEEIAGDDKREVALYGRLEGPTDDTGVVDPGDRGRNVQFRVGVVEEFYGDLRQRSGACILEKVKERKVKRDLSIAEHPRLLRQRWLIGEGRSQNGLP